MSSLYTSEVQAAFRLHRKPYARLQADIVDYEHYLTLRIYQENFESFSESEKALIVEWLSEVMRDLKPLAKIYLERV